MQGMLPALLEDLLFYTYQSQGWLGDISCLSGTLPAPRPTLQQLVNHIRPLIESKGYEKQITANLTATLTTPLESLRRGWKGQLFDQPNSTPWAEIFDRPVIINLSHLTKDAEKTFTIAILLQFLYEYRHAQQELAPQEQNRDLRHLTVIEEGSNILRQSIPPQQNNSHLAQMWLNMLSQLRTYKEGLMMVEETPSTLISEAIKKTNLKITHRLVANEDQDIISRTMALTSEQAAIMNRLRPGQAIVVSNQDDCAAWVQVEN